MNAKLQKESILAHVRAYDYAAALRIAEPIHPLLSERALGLLESAKARGELNWRSIKPEWKAELGLSGCMQNRINIVEYLLWLQMKQRRGDLADFLRGLTPGLYELLKLAVEEKAGYRISDYCDSTGRFCRDWMAEDDMGQELLRLLDIQGKNLDRTFLISGHYATVIEKKCLSEAWAGSLLQLRKIEETVRNPVAHTITRVDEKWLKEKGIVSSQEIVKLLQDAVRLLNQDDGKPLTPKLAIDWGAYDVMNKKITQALTEL